MRAIFTGRVYTHFKGDRYYVIEIGEHTETGEKMVVYKRLSDNKVYIRSYEMFASPVDKDKYPDAKQRFRFELKK